MLSGSFRFGHLNLGHSNLFRISILVSAQFRILNGWFIPPKWIMLNCQIWTQNLWDTVLDSMRKENGQA